MAEWTDILAKGACRWDVYRKLSDEPGPLTFVPPADYQELGISVNVSAGAATLEYPTPSGDGTYELRCVPQFELGEPRPLLRLVGIAGDNIVEAIAGVIGGGRTITEVEGSQVQLDTGSLSWDYVSAIAVTRGV